MESTIPDMQKAAVTKEGKTTITDVTVPKLNPGQILVKIEWSGLCHSDISVMRDYWPSDSPSMFDSYAQNIAGHEGVGRVAALADGVARQRLWSIGDRVGIRWIGSVCHQCEFCLNSGEEEVHCPKQLNPSFSTPGTFQQYVATDASFATRLPDGLSDVDAAPLLCSGITAYGAVKRSQVRAGQWLVILGAGGATGHLALQYAKVMGVRTIAVDVGPKKGKLCQELGAEHYVDVNDCQDVEAKIKEITKYGAHGVVVHTPAEEAYDLGPSLLRPLGTMVVVGFAKNMAFKAGLHPLFFASRMINIVGSTTGTRKDVDEVFDFTVRGLVKPVLTTGSLKDVDEYVNRILDEGLNGKVVLRVDL